MIGPDVSRPARSATLSVCILSWNGERRLPGALESVDAFADEIVVGVDSASDDRTLEVARARADRVFLFEHPGTPEPARLLFLEQATGDWILLLDDDERAEEGFGPLMPQLLGDDRYTHYAFPRKWMVPGSAKRYVRTLPWFPDWQVRLFRNDPRLVWHAPASHSSYRVVGPGCREDRVALLHLERALQPANERLLKVLRYRGLGGRGRFEEFYAPFPREASTALEESAVAPRRGGPFSTPRDRAGIVDLTVHPVVGRSPLPPWGARLDVRHPMVARAGDRVVATVLATNVGGLRWIPPTLEWPRLFISYHLRDPAGEVLIWDGARTPIARVVDPGETASFLPFLEAPGEPGDYVLEWDLVSEGECWFGECGSASVSVSLRVEPGDRSALRPA
jgi:hypothetical protein